MENKKQMLFRNSMRSTYFKRERWRVIMETGYKETDQVWFALQLHSVQQIRRAFDDN